MRLLRFIKQLWIYYSHAFDFKKRFPESTIKTFIAMIPTAWHNSGVIPEKPVGPPTQEEQIVHRVDSTIRGDFLR